MILKLIRPSFYIFILLSSFLCYSQESYNILTIPENLTENSNSVLLEELIEVDASNIKKMKVKTKRVVAVLNKMGSNDTRSYEFYNEHTRVKKISAEVYDALGNHKKRYKKKDFKDSSRSGSDMYVDSRVIRLDYTPTFYPYIMVFESEVETGDSGLLRSMWFLQGYAESLLKSEMRIRYSPDNKIRYKGKNLEGFDIKIDERPEELILSAKNIPAFRYEEYSPSYADILPHVLLSFNTFQLKNVTATVEDWDDFGTWMDEALLGDVNNVSATTVAKMKQLISGETTQEGKARKIYEYVQEKVRYVSIQIGIGGWKPMPASEVDNLSYGDCKALTNYTKSLLDAVGIPSYYTIVYGNESKRDLEEDFASIQGNHVILGIPDGEEIIWLECTSQDAPFGYIGSLTDDRNVVAITSEGGKLLRTKSYSSTENSQKTKASVQLDKNGLLQADFQSVSEGLQYETKYGLSKTKDSDIKKYYKNRWSHINGFSISEVDFINDKEKIAFTEKLQIESSNYLTSVGNDFLLTPNIFNQWDYIPPKIAHRKQKVKINRGFLDEDEIHFEMSPELKIESLPETISIENKFGKYEINFTKLSDHSFKYSRKLHLHKGEYAPEEYENYREFIRSVNRSDRTKILISKNKA